MPHEVFVSYASQDAATALAVCAALERRGLGCWIAPRDVPPGAHYAEAIVTAIKSSRAMVLLFSAHANASPQVLREAERAVSRNVPLIPLRIARVEPTGSMEYLLSSPHWLDASPTPSETQLEALAAAVQRFGGAAAATPSVTTRATLRTPPDLLAAIVAQAALSLMTLITVGIGMESVTEGSSSGRFDAMKLILGALTLAIVMLFGCAGLALRQRWGRVVSIAAAFANIPYVIVFGATLGSVIVAVNDPGFVRGVQLVQAMLSLALLMYLLHPRAAALFPATPK